MKLSYKYHTCDVPLWLLRCLKRRMRWVRAAGCVVEDDEGNRLLIRRNGRWDLPKGKVEAGETLLQAALRETEEETGLRVGSGQWVVDSTCSSVLPTTHYPLSTTHSSLPTTHYPLPTKTYHIFNLYGGWHLKQTSWFAARCPGVQPRGQGQGEEGITEVVWVRPDEWYRRLQHSYGTLKTLSDQWTRSAR